MSLCDDVGRVEDQGNLPVAKNGGRGNARRAVKAFVQTFDDDLSLILYLVHDQRGAAACLVSDQQNDRVQIAILCRAVAKFDAKVEQRHEFTAHPNNVQAGAGPPKDWIALRTTSMPTPRPDRSETSDAVENPGRNRRLSISVSDSVASAAIRPLSVAIC